MPNVGEVVGSGSEGAYSWTVKYVGGVGMNGVGQGIFNWSFDVTNAEGKSVSFGWVAGSDRDLAIRCAKETFRQFAKVPVPI